MSTSRMQRVPKQQEDVATDPEVDLNQDQDQNSPSRQSRRQLRGGRSNVSTACDMCRRRRRKCEGGLPSCITCIQSNNLCTYPISSDKRRKRVGLSEVNALRERIAKLQRQLGERMEDSYITESSAVSDRPSNPYDYRPSGTGISGGSLTLETSGALRFMKATSTFFRTCPASALGPTVTQETPSLLKPYLPTTVDFFHHSLLVDRAFIHLQWAEVIPEASFRDGLKNAALARTNGFSPFLHLVVLAIGCRYVTLEEMIATGGDVDHFDDRGDNFAAAATRMIDTECANPNLGTIRGLLALSSYKVGRGEDRIAICYHSLALGLAQDFRLHLRYYPNLDDDRPTDWQVIESDRLHCLWTCSMVDIFWSSYLGRESSLPRIHFDQSLPIATRDMDEVKLAHAFHARLSHIASQAIELVYVSNVPTEGKLFQLEQCVDAFNRWHDSLPPSLKLDQDPELVVTKVTAHILTLNVFYHALVIVILRPFFGPILSGHLTQRMANQCAASAFEVNRLLRLQRTVLGIGMGPLSNQHAAFIAGSVLVMIACGMSQGTSDIDTAMAFQALDEIVLFLREFSSVWSNARQSADALMGLVDAILSPHDGGL